MGEEGGRSSHGRGDMKKVEDCSSRNSGKKKRDEKMGRRNGGELRRERDGRRSSTHGKKEIKAKEEIFN